MIDAIDTAASGLDVYTINHETIARNLANANTVGFKRNVIAFKSILEEANSNTESLQANTGVDFSKGNLEYTGNSLDIAIDGEGFFTIETDQGLRYTSNGQFHLSENSEIVTSSGGKLLGTSGPLQIPRTGTEIKIDSTGVVKAGNKEIGRLLISNFKQLSGLVPRGESSFSAHSTVVPETEDVNFKIAQGYLEKSNVDVVMEMVNMIANMRNYEASNRIMKTFSDTIERLINIQTNI